MAKKKITSVKVKLTPDQIELAAKYLAMSNICTLDDYKKGIEDITTLKRAVHRAWEDAVTGMMESMEGGYDDRNEGEAIAAVQEEIDSFKKELSGRKAAYWVEQLRGEVPFLFTAVNC